MAEQSKKSAITISPARAAAFHILCKVNEGSAHSDELLYAPNVTALSAADRNLTTTLVMGVLRWQLKLDKDLRGMLDQPLKKINEQVMVAMWMGAYQILYLDRIPDHAALSESVELCRAAGHPYATGMVNAVLRKVTRREMPPAPKRKLIVTAEFLAHEYAHPEWLVARWLKYYGAAVTEKILAANQSAPVAAGCDVDAAVEEAPQASSMFLECGPELPVMDEGSRLIAEMAAANAGARILDSCAAPGGKTLVMALRNPDAKITAADASAIRLERMVARVRKSVFAQNIHCIVADAATLPVEGVFDRILCDVPCSGTGTLARNPEIRLRLRAEDLSKQARRQREILLASLKRLGQGGRLIYSTCSLEPEENQQIVEACLGAEFKILPADAVLRELGGVLTEEAITMLTTTAVRDGYLRTLPGVHPCDGFFAAVIERV